tara:strand:+ start:253 stop:477 length:225 start_codon:yes stop_codon:yes gene_type:complete
MIIVQRSRFKAHILMLFFLLPTISIKMTKIIYKECSYCNQVQPHRVGRRKIGKSGKAPTKTLDYCLICKGGKKG